MNNRYSLFALLIMASYPAFSMDDQRDFRGSINESNRDSASESISNSVFIDSTGVHGAFLSPDACTNLPGYQASVPNGYTESGRVCTTGCVAPATTTVLRNESCPVGHTGARTILATTTHSCPDPFGTPVSNTVDSINADSCVLTPTWPWEAFYGNRSMAIYGKIPKTLNGIFNSSGNLYGWDYIPSYVSSGVGFNSNFTADSFDKTRALLSANGYKLVVMRRHSGWTGEFYSYWSFVATRGDEAFLGIATKGTSRQNRCRWRFVDSCGGDGNRYYYDIPFPVSAGHTTYNTLATNSYSYYGIHDYDSGVGGYFPQTAFMVPRLLGVVTNVSEFYTSAAWRWGNIGTFNVYISQPYSRSQVVCDNARITTIANNGARTNHNLQFNRYCSIGAPFATISDTEQSSYIPMYPEWSVPYNQ